MTDSPRREVVLEPTRCAICGTEGGADVLYPPTFEADAFNERIFSARRLPDRIHYRMVRCRRCGLIRSDPAAVQSSLAELYEGSSFDYAAEVANLRRTYGRYLARAMRRAAGQSLLEIGCGNGFMLEEALAQGYQEVSGVEPSHDAIAAAAPQVRDRIMADVMRPGLFPDATFDTVCMFQVFDHIPDPGRLLDACHAVLTRRGILLLFHHNADALSARLLGERSPIVDIEHCYLFGPHTMRVLLEKHRYDVIEVGAATNTLSIGHLIHLLPLPAGAKSLASRLGRVGGANRLPLRLPLGNLYAIAAAR